MRFQLVHSLWNHQHALEYAVAASFFVFGFCALALHLGLRLLLSRYVHQFTFRRISWTLKLVDVEWEGKTVTEASENEGGSSSRQERTRVKAKSIGLAFRKGKDHKRWFGISAQGITVVMPKSHFARRLKPAAKKELAQEENQRGVLKKIAAVVSKDVKWVHAQLSLLWRAMFDLLGRIPPQQLKEFLQKVKTPLLSSASAVINHSAIQHIGNHTTAVFHSLTAFIRLAVQISDLQLEIQDLFELKTSAIIGVQLSRLDGTGYVTAFAGIDAFTLTPASEISDGKAIQIPDLMVARASIPSATVLEFLRSIKHKEDQQHQDLITCGLEFYDGLKRNPAKPAKSTRAAIFAATRPLLATVDAVRSVVSQNQPTSPLNNVTNRSERLPMSLNYLKLVQVHVPVLEVLHLSESQSQNEVSGFETTLQITDLRIIAAIGQSYQRSSKYLQPEHHPWIGKDQVVPVTTDAGFNSLSLKLKALGDDAYPSQNQAINISETKVVATSTWLPSKLVLSPNVASLSVTESIILAELYLGAVQGDIAYDVLASVVHTVTLPKEEQKPADPKHTRMRPFLQALPPLSLSICSEHSALRIHGPSSSEFVALGTKDSKRTHVETWNRTDAICLEVPAITANLTGEYVPLSIRRSDLQRRAAKKQYRGATDFAPAFFTAGRVTVDPRIHLGMSLQRHDSVYRTQFSFSMAQPIVAALISVDDHLRASSMQSALSQSRSVPRGTLSRTQLAKFGGIEVSANIHWAVSEGNGGVQLLHKKVCAGEAAVIVDELRLDLCKPKIISCLQDLVTIGAHAEKQPRLVHHHHVEPCEAALPLAEFLTANIALSCALATLHVRIGGNDPKNQPNIGRGVILISNDVLFTGMALREASSSLLPSKERTIMKLGNPFTAEVSSLVGAGTPNAAAAQGRMRIGYAALFPLANVDKEDGEDLEEWQVDPADKDWEHRRGEESEETMSGDTPQTKFAHALLVRKFDGKVTITSPLPSATLEKSTSEADSGISPLDHVEIRVELPPASLAVDAFTIYCTLIAASTIRTIMLKKPGSAAPTKVREQVARPKPNISTFINVDELSIHVMLPHHTRLFLHARRVSVAKLAGLDYTIKMDNLAGAVPSPLVSRQWENLLHLQTWTIRVKSGSAYAVTLDTNGVSGRIRIPFKYPLSHIIDNTATLLKAVKQMIHQFIHGHYGSALEPRPEGPKHLPRIDFSIGLFLLEAQDDPFETKLNIIRRAGQTEQKSRQELDDKYEQHIKALRSGKLGDYKPLKKAEIQADAFARLGAYQSASWIKRITNATNEQTRREESLLRQLFGKIQPGDGITSISLSPSAKVKPLARMILTDLRLSISRPSFGDSLENVQSYLHKVGGLPKDTDFILLVPFRLAFSVKEVRFNLRDYPLPLLHVPPSNVEGVKAWDFTSDMVIAEEFPEPASIRRATCAIVEPRANDCHRRPYSIIVPRSAMPTKMYAMPTIRIRSKSPTRFSWSPSVQPTISDFIRVVDSITKPPPDPSEKPGFWDKFRLVAHGEIKVIFDGDVHFNFKGSRDPYALDGHSAGFLKCFSGNVRLHVNVENAQRELVQMMSDRYYLGVPDLSQYVDAAASGNFAAGQVPDAASTNSSSTSASRDAHDSFHKVMGELVDGVRWGMGFQFERACTDATCTAKPKCEGSPFHRKCRIFKFKDHWQVKTRTAEGAYREDGEVVDSYAGFRSHFIHFSISLTSPVAGSAVASSDHARSTLHFSPLLMSHFHQWWQLFDSTMSLPIRQGKLFPSILAPSKKFGRHCATIKYRFDLEPMFVSHMYRQEDEQDWADGRTTVLGIKCKAKVLKIDLHQREEEFSIRRPEMNKTTIVRHKKFYLAEVHSGDVDLRVIAAVFKDPEKAECVGENISKEGDAFSKAPPTLAAADLEWVDFQDFVDLGPSLTRFDENSKPDDRKAGNYDVYMHRILRARSATYYRQPTLQDAAVVPGTEGCDAAREEPVRSIATRRTKFGSEPTHQCLVGQAPMEKSIAKERLETLEKLYESSSEKTPLPKLTDRLVRPRSFILGNDEEPQRDRLAREELALRIKTVKKVLNGLEQVRDGNQAADPLVDGIALPLISSRLSGDFKNWSNRVIVHGLQAEIDNDSRDILRKYYHSNRARKAYAFQLTARAAKFLDDLARSQAKAAQTAQSPQRQRTNRTATATSGKTSTSVDDLPSQASSHIWAHSATTHSRGPDDGYQRDPRDDVQEGIPDEFETKCSLLVVLLRPQFLLQSKTDKSTRLIVTTLLDVLRTYAIEDPSIRDDPINSTLMHRSYVEFCGVQAFYPLDLANDPRSDIFVPMEVLADNALHPFDYNRVVPTTDVMLKYDKYNHLRISHRSSRHSKLAEFNLRSQTDEITIGVSKLGMSANRDQFSALYAIVSDLVLHSDPSRRQKSEKLEALLLVTDFSDVGKRKNAILDYQRNIRSRKDTLQSVQYQINGERADARQEFFMFQRDTIQESEALAMEMEAIRQSQHGQLTTGASQGTGTRIDALAHETTWMMNDDADAPFVKVILSSTRFIAHNKSDGMVRNQLLVKNLSAYNMTPDYVFHEIVAKYSILAETKLAAKMNSAQKADFMVATWNVLPSVGGISIVNRMELHLHPFSLQLEKRIGLDMLDYIAGRKEISHGGFRFGGDKDDSEKKSKPNKVEENGRTKATAGPTSNLVPPSSSSLSSLFSYSTSSQSSSSVNLLRHHKSHEQLRAVVPLMADVDNDYLPVEEMRKRARSYHSFGVIHISETVMCLSYRALGKTSLANLYGLTVRLPPLSYHNRIASYRDIIELAKGDVKSCLLGQTGSLISQVLTTARKPTNFARAQSTKIKKASSKMTRNLIKGSAESERHSPLKQTFDPAEESDEESPRLSPGKLPAVDKRTPSEPMPYREKEARLAEADDNASPTKSDDSVVTDEKHYTTPRRAGGLPGTASPTTTNGSTTMVDSDSSSDASDVAIMRPIDRQKIEKLRKSIDSNDPDHLVHHKHPLAGLAKHLNPFSHHRKLSEDEKLNFAKEKMILGQNSESLDSH